MQNHKWNVSCLEMIEWGLFSTLPTKFPLEYTEQQKGSFWTLRNGYCFLADQRVFAEFLVLFPFVCIQTKVKRKNNSQDIFFFKFTLCAFKCDPTYYHIFCISTWIAINYYKKNFIFLNFAKQFAHTKSLHLEKLL